MLISRNREKLINAIVYFASHTQHVGKVKLFKLLYLLDFAHFRETGRSVTGMDYRAWKMGPVPLDLMQEWEGLEPDMAKAVDIVPETGVDHMRYRVVPKVTFDDSYFSKRELRLMQELATRFHKELTTPMTTPTGMPSWIQRANTTASQLAEKASATESNEYCRPGSCGLPTFPGHSKAYFRIVLTILNMALE
jgi:hypothetical protein